MELVEKQNGRRMGLRLLEGLMTLPLVASCLAGRVAAAGGYAGTQAIRPTTTDISVMSSETK